MALYRFVERQYLATLGGYLANSNTTVASVEQLLGQPLPHYVAYPAADHLPAIEPVITRDEITQRANAAGPLQILFVGNLIARKGLHLLLDALTHLDPATWRLTLAGRNDVDHDYTKQIRAKIETLGLGAQVSWHGRAPTVNWWRFTECTTCWPCPPTKGSASSTSKPCASASPSSLPTLAPPMKSSPRRRWLAGRPARRTRHRRADCAGGTPPPSARNHGLHRTAAL
ncbi:MAG: glycosyltransferase family 4 protein [Anaerolineales bacterium]|nr:glycosyltransferase family 4 protein [Anaerolineales bacterium]